MQFENANGLTLSDFKTYVAQRLSHFSKDWLKHQKESPCDFPDAISLEEWWNDFAELMESHVREATVESMLSSSPDCAPHKSSAGGEARASGWTPMIDRARRSRAAPAPSPVKAT